MDFTRQQCLEIIDLYHQRPILWNPRHPSYFNKVKKDDAWREIAEICGRDVENIQKKVESLKGSYRRERAKVKKSTGTGKGKDETYTSQWFAFDYLRFLDDKDEPRRSINNLQPNSPEDGINTSSEIEDFTDEPRNNTEIEASQNDEPALETSEGAAPSEIKTKTFKSPKKRAVKRRKEEEEDPRIMQAFGYLQNVASGSASNKRDDCSVYGEHVANKIRKFDDRLKSLAQHRINNILFDLEMSHYNSSAAPQPLREFAPGYPQTMSTNQYDYQQVSTRFPQYSFNNCELLPPMPQTPPTPAQTSISRSSTPTSSCSHSGTKPPMPQTPPTPAQTSISRSSTPTSSCSHSGTNSALQNYFASFSDDTGDNNSTP